MTPCEKILLVSPDLGLWLRTRVPLGLNRENRVYQESEESMTRSSLLSSLSLCMRARVCVSVVHRSPILRVDRAIDFVLAFPRR